MQVTYKLDTFEGPLDLLLHLIDKSEVDIYNIPIKTIADQYMIYLDTMKELEMDITSEFLVMAATLLAIKSYMLLPKPPVIEMDWGEEEGPDPRDELVQKLIEYRKFKGIAEHLREKELARSLIYTREPEDLTPFATIVSSNPLEGLHIADIVWAFQKAIRKKKVRSRVAKIRRDEISVKDRMKQVLDSLSHEEGKISFSQLLSEELTRDEIVVTFLALLELMKMKRIFCYQNSLFEDIVIQARGAGTWNGFTTFEVDY